MPSSAPGWQLCSHVILYKQTGFESQTAMSCCVNRASHAPLVAHMRMRTAVFGDEFVYNLDINHAALIALSVHR